MTQVEASFPGVAFLILEEHDSDPQVLPFQDAATSFFHLSSPLSQHCLGCSLLVPFRPMLNPEPRTQSSLCQTEGRLPLPLRYHIYQAKRH